MRNFLGILGAMVGGTGRRPAMPDGDLPVPAAGVEAMMSGSFDLDAIWYYERLKWRARD
jgi:hypothetical protein